MIPKSLKDAWGGKLVQVGREFKGPCPFCTPSQDGIIWEGTDRFVIFSDGTGGYCRHCETYRPMQKIMQKLGLEYDEKSVVPAEIEEKPLSGLWTFRQVQEAHRSVSYEFWLERYGWDSPTVDRFLLGWGTLYARWVSPQHLIPMTGLWHEDSQQDVHDLFYMSSRPAKERSSGSSKPYMWVIHDDPSDTSIYLTEGETDAISARSLGFRNICCTFGARTWTAKKAQRLVAAGFKRVILLPDNDKAGNALLQQQATTCRMAGLAVDYIDWTHTDAEEVNDISNLLRQVGVEAARAFVLNNILALSAPINPQNGYSPGKGEIVPLSELRGLGATSLTGIIEEFVENYATRKKPTALQLAAAPGAGKTHALIRAAESRARPMLDKYLREKADIEVQMETASGEALQKLQKKLDKLSATTVVWYAPFKDLWDDIQRAGADSALWYNFEARNETNCRDHETVLRLGDKNHEIGKYCQTVCPFFQQCKQDGYWKQDTERKQFPITFFRHQQLMASYAEDANLKMVIVDEYLGKLLESSPITFEAADVYPTTADWQDGEDNAESVDAVIKFAEALRSVLSYNTGAPAIVDKAPNPNYVISGSTIFRLLDAYLEHYNTSIAQVLSKIDEKHLVMYHPNYSGEEVIKLRCLPAAYVAFYRELPSYVADRDNKFPTCLHIVAGKAELYAAAAFNIRNKTPVVIADATGLPAVYQGLLGREVEWRNPRPFNMNARYTVITGSDYTKRTLEGQLGKVMRDKARAKKQREKVEQLSSVVAVEEYSPDETYDSAALDTIQAAITKLRQKHKSLLVVTHKNLKELIEDLVTSSWQLPPIDRFELGHYGALRGTNRYEDIEAVLLVGAYRVPYQIVWRWVQMWAFLLGIKEEIPSEVVYKKDGSHSYPTLSSPSGWAEAVTDMIELSELVQVGDRIRPHSTDKPKFIYALVDRGLQAFVDFHIDTLSTDAWLVGERGGAHTEALDYVRTCLRREGKTPPFRILTEKFGISNKTAAKLIQKAKQEAVND